MFYCPTNFTFQRLFPNAGSKIITELSSLEDSPCLERDKLSNRTSVSLTGFGGIATTIGNYLLENNPVVATAISSYDDGHETLPRPGLEKGQGIHPHRAPRTARSGIQIHAQPRQQRRHESRHQQKGFLPPAQRRASTPASQNCESLVIIFLAQNYC